MFQSQVNTLDLKLKIKAEGKNEHILKGKEKPVNKYDRGTPSESLPQRPGKWVKGALVNPKNHQFDPKTTSNLADRGHFQNLAQKQNQRFDSLKNARGQIQGPHRVE